MPRKTPQGARAAAGRGRRRTARAASGEKVPLRFRSLLTAVRVREGLRLPAVTTPLPDDVMEICDLVRQASAVGRSLVTSIFDDMTASLHQATYLNEIATLTALLGGGPLVSDLDAALDDMRAGRCHPNDVLKLVITLFSDDHSIEVSDLWQGKRALEELSLKLEIRHLARAQVNEVATTDNEELDLQLQVEYRAQTADLLHILADLCDQVDELLHQRSEEQPGDASVSSLALFAAYAERAATLGEPLTVELTSWLEQWRGDDRDEAATTTAPLDFTGQAARVAPATLAAVGVAQGVVAPEQIVNPEQVAQSIWPNGVDAPTEVTTPWAAPAPEFGDWQYVADPAPDIPGPAPKLQVQLKTTGTYSFEQAATYFGFRSRAAMQFFTAENLDLFTKIPANARLIPAGHTVVVPATLLPTSVIRAVEDTATSFDVDAEAIARLNPRLIIHNQAGQPVLNPNAAGFLLTPVGKASMLSDEGMSTAPLAFDLAGDQTFTAAALLGQPGVTPTQTVGRTGGVSATEAPSPRLRHVRLHHTLAESTTITALASRLGLPTGALAEYNGLTDLGRPLAKGATVLIPGTAHRVAEAETVEQIAKRYEAPRSALELLNGKLFVGQVLFVPQPPTRLLAEGVFEAKPPVAAPRTAAPSQPQAKTNQPSQPQPKTVPATPPAKPSTSSRVTGGAPAAMTASTIFPDYVELPNYLADWDQYKAYEASLRAKYGQKLYPTLQAIPDDLREFYLTSVYWGAQFIGVPWQAVLAIHNTEVVGKGYRPFEQAVSFAAARGPGQITPGYWNGWGGTSRSAAPSKNFADIIKGGGNGFHWGLRSEWLRYLRHEVGLDALQSSDADIMHLINNVVATARGLYRNGVRADAFAQDPKQWSAANIKTLRNAVMIYNSGGTNPAIRQCAGCAWTVGDYANNAERVVKGLPASPFDFLPGEARNRALRQELFVGYDRAFGAALSAQQIDQVLKANGDKVGDLSTGRSDPAQVAQGMLQRQADEWLKKGGREPNQWPFFENKEAMEVQQAAARRLATLLDKPTLDALMKQHHNNVQAIETSLASRVDARLVQMARETLERVSPGRVVLNTRVRPLVDEAIREVFKGNVDPGQPGLDQRLAEARTWFERRVGGQGQGSREATPQEVAPQESRPTPLEDAIQTAAPAIVSPVGPTRQAAQVRTLGLRAARSVKAPLEIGETGRQGDRETGRQGAGERGSGGAGETGEPESREADGKGNGMASSRITDHGSLTFVPVGERFIRLSAQVQTKNQSIQNNIRLFAARSAGRLDEFKEPGKGVKINWDKLKATEVEAEIVIQPGAKLDYVKQFGPFSAAQGYAAGPLVGGGTAPGVGACQVATLLKAAALHVPTLKVWNGVKHPTIPGLSDVSAVSILSGDARQNLHITNTGSTPVIFRMRVSGDTATVRAEVATTGNAPATPDRNPSPGPSPIKGGGGDTAPPNSKPSPGSSPTKGGGGDTAPPNSKPSPGSSPIKGGGGDTASPNSNPSPGPSPTKGGASDTPSLVGRGQGVGLRIIAGAGELVGKYAYGNLRAGPAQGFYVCTDVVNYALDRAGTPIVKNYKDAGTVRWVGTHMAWFKGATHAKMVSDRQREFKPAATLPEPGWVIFIQRQPYREASHEGIVKQVDINGDQAVVTTLEALGAFKGDPYNKANNVQTTTYTYHKTADGSWRQTGITRTNLIVGYGVVKG